jgi:two-component system sensor histidine kinase/response regulator
MRLLLLLAALLPLPAGALEKVTLQLKWKHQFQFAGYYAAQEKGYYREAGLEVDIVEAGPETDPVREVLDGRAQFGVSNSALILARAAGQAGGGAGGDLPAFALHPGGAARSRHPHACTTWPASA